MSINQPIGTSLDDLLKKDGTLSEVNILALKRVLSWQVAQEMKSRGISKSAMAKAMSTSRAALDRLLDPENTSVTLHTLERAAFVIGKRLRIELADA